MKKKMLSTLALALTMGLMLTACGSSDSDSESSSSEAEESTEEETTEEEESTEESEEEESEAAEGTTAMTYEEFLSAEVGDEVVIETYVQAKEAWSDETVTVYAQDEEGAYLISDMTCSEDDYELLTEGTKICVTGYKSDGNGGTEIIDATFEILDDGETYIAVATDMTALLGAEELSDYQNWFVALSGLTVEASTDADGNECAFLYGEDGSGAGDSNSDLYLTVSLNGESYTVMVNAVLCDEDSEVYQTVTALEIGDVIDLEGFLSLDGDVTAHVTAVTVTTADADGTDAEEDAAEETDEDADTDEDTEEAADTDADSTEDEAE